MPVPNTINDLSTTASSNQPGGGENPFPDLDDHLRKGYSFIATLRDLVATKLNSAAVSAFGLTLIDDADAATARNTLGAVGKTGDETVAGAKTFSGAATFSVSPSVPTPTNASDAANKSYTDTAAANAASSAANSAVSNRFRYSVSSVLSATGGIVDFDNVIPSWAQRVTLAIYEVSTNGTSRVQVFLQTSAGFTTSGYRGSFVYAAAGNQSVGGNVNTSFTLDAFASPNDLRDGSVEFNKIPGTNTWVQSGVIGLSNAAAVSTVGGAVPLPGVLTGIRVSTNSSDVFDNGTFHLLIEG